MSLPVVRLGRFDRLQCLNNKVGVAQIESSLGSELLVNGILWLFTHELFKIRQGDVIVFRPKRTDRLVELGLVGTSYRRGTLRRLPRHGQKRAIPHTVNPNTLNLDQKLKNVVNMRWRALLVCGLRTTV